MAGQGQLQPAAKGQAVNAGHHGLCRPLDFLQHRVTGGRKLDDAGHVAGGQISQEELDVGPGGKRLAHSANHHAADVLGRHRLAQCLVQLEHHRRIQRVAAPADD